MPHVPSLIPRFSRIVLIALLLYPAAAVAADTQFAGTWDTDYGPLFFIQEGEQVEAVYAVEGQPCVMEGTVTDSRFNFTFREPDSLEEPGNTGDGWFEIDENGRLHGEWKNNGAEQLETWEGTRVEPVVDEPPQFEGVWQTTFGRMRLDAEGDRVDGIYAYLGGSTVEGQIDGRKLTIRYREPDADGEAYFYASDDGALLFGKWRTDAEQEWSDWSAARVETKPSRVWLVVIEARWESSLADQEFSFGSMLKAYFARDERVEVRHRFFNDAASLKRWCAELAYLPEPVVLCIATHGAPQGLDVDGQVIGPEAIADALHYARNLQLVHFSSCSIMREDLAQRLLKSLPVKPWFAVSGYTTEVDWGTSAVLEFLYFDLLLIRELPPHEAAKQLLRLTPLAGTDTISDSVLGSAGFKILLPDEAKSTRVPPPKPIGVLAR